MSKGADGLSRAYICRRLMLGITPTTENVH